MSDDTATSTIQTSEPNDEAQQESSQSFNEELVVEVEANVNDLQENTEDGSESSASPSAVNISDEVVSGERSCPQSSEDASVKYSEERSFSGNFSGVDSQSDDVTQTQEDGDDTESPKELQSNGATVDTESQPGGSDEAVSGERSLPQSSQQDASVKYSKERSFSGNFSGVESQSDDVTVDTQTQEGGDDTESPKESQPGGAAVGTESQPGNGSSTNSEYSTAVSDLSRQTSLGSSSGDHGSGHSREIAATIGTVSQPGGSTAGIVSQPGGATVGIKSLLGYASSTNSEYSYTTSGLSRQTSLDSSSGDYGSAHSRETAIVCDSSSQSSLQSGTAGDVSNSTNTQDRVANGTGSWEGMAATIQTRQMPSQEERDETDDMRNYTECFRHCACLCDYMRPCSRWLQNSKINTLFKVIAVITSFLTFVLGATCMHECPVRPWLPFLLMLMGMALGAILIINLDPNCCPIIGRIFFYLTFSMLFILVLSLTYTLSPTFEHKDQEDFCRKEFYYFVYYVNFVVVGIIILAFFIHVPTMIGSANDYEQL